VEQFYQEGDVVEGNKYISWVQQSSFKQTSDNPALEKTSPKTGSFAFYQKDVLSMKQAGLRDMFENAYKGVCTSTVAVSPDPLCPTPSTFWVMKTPDETEQNPYDPEPADEGDIRREYSSG
jgi:hypothetical protein